MKQVWYFDPSGSRHTGMGPYLQIGLGWPWHVRTFRILPRPPSLASNGSWWMPCGFRFGSEWPVPWQVHPARHRRYENVWRHPPGWASMIFPEEPTGHLRILRRFQVRLFLELDLLNTNVLFPAKIGWLYRWKRFPYGHFHFRIWTPFGQLQYLGLHWDWFPWVSRPIRGACNNLAHPQIKKCGFQQVRPRFLRSRTFFPGCPTVRPGRKKF